MSNKCKALLFCLTLLCGILYSCEDGTEELIDPIIVAEGGRFLQGYPVKFSAEIPSTAKISNVSFYWDFGDGFSDNGIEVEHTYSDTGDYVVSLSVEGKTSSKTTTREIYVKPSLELLASVTINVDEPSGLTLGLGGTSLWTVSDRTGDIYQIDFEGTVMKTLNINGGDLEGISFDKRDSTFWICKESINSIAHIDSTGNTLLEKEIPRVSEGSGLEGISIDTDQDLIYAIKEKNNSALIQLNDSLESLNFQRLGFAPDLSGASYSKALQGLWVLSHEASSVFLLDTSGMLLESYGIVMNQPEGIVFDDEFDLFYIVDDATEKLNTYGFWSQTPSF